MSSWKSSWKLARPIHRMPSIPETTFQSVKAMNRPENSGTTRNASTRTTIGTRNTHGTHQR